MQMERSQRGHATYCYHSSEKSVNAHEQLDSAIRMDHSPVMLSAAKHLCAERDRPFAEFTLSGSEGLRMNVEVPISSSVLFFESSSTDASVTNTTGEVLPYVWI